MNKWKVLSSVKPLQYSFAPFWFCSGAKDLDLKQKLFIDFNTTISFASKLQGNQTRKTNIIKNQCDIIAKT